MGIPLPVKNYYTAQQNNNHAFSVTQDRNWVCSVARIHYIILIKNVEEKHMH